MRNYKTRKRLSTPQQQHARNAVFTRKQSGALLLRRTKGASLTYKFNTNLWSPRAKLRFVRRCFAPCKAELCKAHSMQSGALQSIPCVQS